MAFTFNLYLIILRKLLLWNTFLLIYSDCYILNMFANFKSRIYVKASNTTYVLYTIFYVIALLSNLWILILATKICDAHCFCVSLSLSLIFISKNKMILQMKLVFKILQSVPTVCKCSLVINWEWPCFFLST